MKRLTARTKIKAIESIVNVVEALEESILLRCTAQGIKGNESYMSHLKSNAFDHVRNILRR